ncbi:7250_t:CDS:2 [Entrophospora sp. SA101]|nr:7250_t:CDS:2 [Entrophospora sp. SA101]
MNEYAPLDEVSNASYANCTDNPGILATTSTTSEDVNYDDNDDNSDGCNIFIKDYHNILEKTLVSLCVGPSL